MFRTPVTAVASTALALATAALLHPLASVAAEPAATSATSNAAAPTTQTPTAPTANTIANVIQSGKARAEFRYRFEGVDQDPFEDDAYASTLRTRLGFDSGSWQGLSAALEFDNVTVLGDDDEPDAP